MNYIFGLIIVGLVVDSQSQKSLDVSTKSADRSKIDAEFVSSAIIKVVNGSDNIRGLDRISLPSLKPLGIPSLSFDTNHLFYTVSQNYTNGKINELTESFKITDKRIDRYERVLYMNASNDRIEFVADYVLNGKFLEALFSGNGTANITLLDVATEIIVHWEEYEIDNVEFLNVTQCEVKLLPRQILFDFTNFIGCRDYADSEKNAFMNINSAMFFEPNKGPLEEKLGSVFMGIANKILNAYPEDELIQLFKD